MQEKRFEQRGIKGAKCPRPDACCAERLVAVAVGRRRPHDAGARSCSVLGRRGLHLARVGRAKLSGSGRTILLTKYE